MKIRIKRKLGFCEKKGCWNRQEGSRTRGIVKRTNKSYSCTGATEKEDT